jgi:GT2 family glycosyltransferase
MLEVTKDPEVRVIAGSVYPPPGQESQIGPYSRVVVASGANAGWCATANLALRRDDLASVNGFDEGFVAVAAEDTDVALRILANGGTFAFAGRAVVMHEVEAGNLLSAVQDRFRWDAIPLLFRDHPEARKHLLVGRVFWKRSHPQFLAMVIGLALAQTWPAFLLLTGPWLHDKLCSAPVVDHPVERIRTLPGMALLDLTEVGVMVRGSLKHRQLLL